MYFEEYKIRYVRQIFAPQNCMRCVNASREIVIIKTFDTSLLILLALRIMTCLVFIAHKQPNRFYVVSRKEKFYTNLYLLWNAIQLFLSCLCWCKSILCTFLCEKQLFIVRLLFDVMRILFCCRVYLFVRHKKSYFIFKFYRC